MVDYYILQERIRIGQIFAKIRKEKGLSTYQLAELTGIRQPHISRLENGRSNASTDTINKVASALGVRIELNYLTE
ncbi:MAG: helix-turn-helix domain-containing protein [Prevotellaceae bacterium]|jgi:transcriptional regulator with XRE-family HTH domain|nr:helix-turn-helix domain-containing protein [Prevotellaceae bacterium]